jgi:hypothetical protein
VWPIFWNQSRTRATAFDLVLTSGQRNVTVLAAKGIGVRRIGVDRGPWPDSDHWGALTANRLSGAEVPFERVGALGRAVKPGVARFACEVIHDIVATSLTPILTATVGSSAMREPL